MVKNFFIRKATDADLKQILANLDYFEVPNSKFKFFPRRESVFVAYRGRTVIGFITLRRMAPGHFAIENLYVRLGERGNSVGSKLFGKANALMVRKKVKKATVQSQVSAIGFYKKTNYAQSPKDSNFFNWVPKANPRTKRPRREQFRFGLARAGKRK
jgi:N-acetylglutamate synthase-like GNAT family acetyltransferase